MRMSKLCKDCKWMRDPGRFARCEAPQNFTDSATGFETLVAKYTYCSAQRMDAFDSCRRSGDWFEPREPEAVAA